MVDFYAFYNVTHPNDDHNNLGASAIQCMVLYSGCSFPLDHSYLCYSPVTVSDTHLQINGKLKTDKDAISICRNPCLYSAVHLAACHSDHALSDFHKRVSPRSEWAHVVWLFNIRCTLGLHALCSPYHGQGQKVYNYPIAERLGN